MAFRKVSEDLIVFSVIIFAIKIIGVIHNLMLVNKENRPLKQTINELILHAQTSKQIYL